MSSVLLSSCTCSAERETGPSLGWSGGEVFRLGVLEGPCGCDWGVRTVAGGVSGVPFSGMLCKIKAKTLKIAIYNIKIDFYLCNWLYVCVIFTLWTLSPCLEYGWETEHPGLSWGTPDLSSSSRHTHAPPLPRRVSYEMHQPMTGDGREKMWWNIVKMTDSYILIRYHSRQFYKSFVIAPGGQWLNTNGFAHAAQECTGFFFWFSWFVGEFCTYVCGGMV